ncbi:GNAT family N-acetyltransferase [Acinetobacter baumannii]|nr:GNAT family N-acetyltransferase [Acinetobacter baumannii]
MLFSLVNLRVAHIGDLDLIYQTVLEDAAKGHYSEMYCSNYQARAGLQVNLKNMIENEIRINTIVQNNYLINKNIFSRVVVLEKSKRPIGFCIVSSVDGSKDLEIWMFSIFKDFRNKGYGQKFLKKLLKSIRKTYPTIEIVARCFENSKIMMSILENNNFIEENSSYEARFFRLKSS